MLNDCYICFYENLNNFFTIIDESGKLYLFLIDICLLFYLADLSKMSISDLENIQETDTPPQSPSSSKEEPEDKATVNVCSPPSASSVQYLKVQLFLFT